MTALLVTDEALVAIEQLKKKAHANVLDVREIMRACATRKGKARHLLQMTHQSIIVPFGYCVTFSVESGHPAGTCLHMSMSSPDPKKVPVPAAVWMMAEYLGFRGGLDACTLWEEELKQGKVINVVQPIPC